MKQVAVVGAGKWGRNLVRVFHECGALAAVVEANPILRQQVMAEYPTLLVTDSYEAILSSAIPAVIIATPVSTHYHLTRAALENDKDVFVEKPMTMTSSEAEELQALAMQKEKILMVGHLLLYQSAITWIRDYVASGELGRLHSIHQRRIQLGRVRTTENALWSLGVHDVAVLLHLVGQEPLEITGSGQRVLQKEIEDDLYVHLTFPDQVNAHLHVSWMWPQPERKMIVIGSCGMLEYQELEQTVTLHRKSVQGDFSFRNDGSEVLFTGNKQPLHAEAEHFLRCLKTREMPRSDGSSGVAVIRVLEKVMSIMKEGQTR